MSKSTGMLRPAILVDVINAIHYYYFMIASFRDVDTETLAGGTRVRRFLHFEVVARRKLRQLEIASCLDDLRVPPGNHLEALKGDRVGQHSIRINDQYRICFRWRGDSAFDVEITDYH
jgi:proteic killer suppression protein